MKNHDDALNSGRGDRLFGRLRSLWDSALQHRPKEQQQGVRAYWLQSSTLIFSWRYISEKRIDINQLRGQVLHQVMLHEQAFRDLFPDAFASSELAHIQIATFQEDDTASSLFDLPANQAFLHPLSQKLMDALHKKGLLTGSWMFSRSQAFLSSLLVITYLTTGVPPRAFQAADFRYTASGKQGRAFRLIDGVHGAFVNPKTFASKTVERVRVDNALWLLPPQVTLTLLLYLGVFRPVEGAISIQTFPPDHVAPLRTHIFCSPERRAASIIWSPDNVEECLKRNSPLGVEAYAQCLIYSKILHQLFKAQVETMQDGILLNKQSQHAPRTSVQHYAVERLQNVTGLQYTTRERQMRIGQEFHAFFYLVRPISTMDQDDKGQSSKEGVRKLMDIMVDTEHALYVARHAILQTYQLAALPAEEASARAKALISELPFIHHIGRSAGSGAGSAEGKLLVLVARALKGSGLSQCDSVRLVATSAALVRNPSLPR